MTARPTEDVARAIRRAMATTLTLYGATLVPANRPADDPGRGIKNAALRALVAAHVVDARADARSIVLRIAREIGDSGAENVPEFRSDAIAHAARFIGRHAYTFAEFDNVGGEEVARELEAVADQLGAIVQPRRTRRFIVGVCPEYVVVDDAVLVCGADMWANVDSNPTIECDGAEHHRWIPSQWNRLYHKVRNRA